MIKSINIGTGLLQKFWGERVDFTPDINVIYGPNGSGKTMLLDVLGHYTFVKGKGWSKEVSFMDVGFQSSLYNFDILEALDKKSLFGQCELDWDGVPVFKTQGILPKEWSSWVVSKIMCGCDNEEDISYNKLRNIHSEHMSNGQTANFYIQNMLELEVPDLTLLKSETKWKREYKNLVADYVVTLGRGGKPTLLIDEIDGVLDFDNLYKFWNESIIELSKRFQVIIVTHNPFFLRGMDINIIGMDYFAHSMELLERCV